MLHGPKMLYKTGNFLSALNVRLPRSVVGEKSSKFIIEGISVISLGNWDIFVICRLIINSLASTHFHTMAHRPPALSLLVPVLLSFIATSFLANANPLIQKPFTLPKDTAKQSYSPLTDGRPPPLDIALKALNEASSQVIETFENVMSELGDISNQFTWSLPKKEVTGPRHDWDFRVSTSVLPEHSLRVKKPDSLGVDDVKQVQIIAKKILISSILGIWMSVNQNTFSTGFLRVAITQRRIRSSCGLTEVSVQASCIDT